MEEILQTLKIILKDLDEQRLEIRETGKILQIKLPKILAECLKENF